jgi:Chlorophyll A-B binding protein
MNTESDRPESEAPEPTATVTDTEEPVAKAPSAFGWTAHAEQLNGRFAMVGFIALLLLELLTRQDFFTWLGMP